MPVPALSDSEWLVMEILWQSAPRTASEAARALRERTGWADNTVRTLLSRLVQKGAVRAADNTSGIRQFRPAIQREVLVRAEGRTFMERVFGGAAKPLLAHFAENARLTPDEVRGLKRLLDQSLKNQK